MAPDPSSLELASYLNFLLTHRVVVVTPWIVGSTLDVFLGGVYLVLLVQLLVTYFKSPFNRNHSDGRRPPRILILVCVVTALTTFKSALALYILFLNSIILSNDPLRLTIAVFTNWVMVTSPLMTQLVNLAVQSYYITLLYNLFRVDAGQLFHPLFRAGLFAMILICIVAATTMGTLAVYELLSFKFRHPGLYLTLQLGASFIGDALITGGTVYCLLKSNSYCIRDKSSFARFARFIAYSAFIPAVLALFNLSIVAANVYYNRWHIIFDFALSKVFAISFIWTLQLRRRLVLQKSTTSNRANVPPSRCICEPTQLSSPRQRHVSNCPAFGSPAYYDVGRYAEALEARARVNGKRETDEYLASPSMLAATVPAPRTEMSRDEEDKFEMGVYIERIPSPDGINGQRHQRFSLVQVEGANRGREAAREGTKEKRDRNSSETNSPVKTTFLNLKS